MGRVGAVPLFAGFLSLLAGVGGSIFLAHLDGERRASDERSMVVTEAAVVRERIEGALRATFNSTDGLVHLVSLQGGIAPELFADMAGLAIGKNRHVRNITLAPDDVIGMVHPLAGNEKAIGLGFATVSEQYVTVTRARIERQAVLAGPVNLVQGGRALINRAPVFVRAQAGAPERYWGAASIVAYLSVVDEALATPQAARLNLGLRGKDGLGAAGGLVSGDASVFVADPVVMDIPVPGGHWQLGAVPKGGWRAAGILGSVYFPLGVALSLLISVLLTFLVAGSRAARARNRVLEQEVRERKRVEAALRDEELRFRVLFDTSPDPAWIIEDKRFVECNAAAARVLGYADGAEMLFVHPSRLSPEIQPDGEASFIKAERMMEQVMAHGVHRFEWMHRRADGSDFPAEVTLSRVVLKGKPVIHCVWRDISERREADEALRASRKLLQAIIESAGAVIYVFDTEGRLVLCNHQFEEVVGVRREAVLGMTRHAFMPGAVADEHLANDHAVIAAGRRTSFEEHNVEADGVHHYLTVKCPIIDDDGVRGVVGISTDITVRKQDEERLKLAATVLSATAEGVVVTDVAGRIVSVNRAFTEITGYTEDEVRGANPSILQSERQGPEFYQAMWAAIRAAGVWQGEIWNRRKSGELFPEWLTISAIEDAEGRVSHYVGVFSDISSIKHSQERLEHLAHFDPLTDLPNRVLFQDRLAHALDRAVRYAQNVAVLLLDLDGFKIVNDSLGHPAGDRLLTEVAARLRAAVRVEDTVARLGGDEFAVILAPIEDSTDAVEVARKLLVGIEAPFDLDGMGGMVTGSIGIAVFPGDGQTPVELVRNADAAMYGAKEAGRNTYRFYQASMTHRAQERLHRESALRRALEQQEFEVWLQPQINVHTGRMTGAEALLRWRDPEQGLVPPAEFIPLAERTGLILPIGEWVLGEVCSLARRWRDAGIEFGRLAVNVAAPQIERGDFVASIRTALERWAVPADCLEIEITESIIMESAADAREVLGAIQALGVTTAIDDFGTGYSSLAALKALPIDSLKIDRAFITGLPDDPDDIAIARAVIAMAHSLGFKVIAEGVEEEGQRDFMRAEGCDEVQGYLIGRPMPVAEFERWLQAFAGA